MNGRLAVLVALALSAATSAPADAWPPLRVFTIAGVGQLGDAGDGGFAADARLRPSAVTALPDGGLLVVEADAYRIRLIDPLGRIRTVAGNGRRGESPDGVLAARAAIRPGGRALPLAGGGFAFAEPEAARVRAVGSDGRLRTIAGRGAAGYHGDGGPATDAQLDSPELLASLPDGSVLARTGSLVRRFSVGGSITTVVGSQPCALGGNALTIPMYPYDVAVAPDGSALIADSYGCLRRLSPDGLVATIAGSGAAAPGLNAPSSAFRLAPLDIAMAPYRAAQLPDGSVAVADANDAVIFRVAANGAVTASRPGLQPSDVAGLPDGTLASVAFGDSRGPLLQGPGGSVSWIPGVVADSLAAAPDGSLVVGQMQAGRVMRVGRDGTITAVAGGGSGPGADGDPATDVALSQPVSLAVAQDGTIFIGEQLNPGGRVRRVDPSGRIWTVAGSGQPGIGGDGGPATQAQLTDPTGLALAPDGSLWIADVGWDAGGRVRRVAPDGTIGTVAGGDAAAPAVGGAAAALSLAGVAALAPRGNGGFALYDASPAHELTTAQIDGSGTISALERASLCARCSARAIEVEGGVRWQLTEDSEDGEPKLERVRGPARDVVMARGRPSGFFGSPDGGPARLVDAADVTAFDALPDGGLAWATADGRIRLALRSASARLATAIVRDTLRAALRHRLVYRLTTAATVTVDLLAGPRRIGHAATRGRRGLNTTRLPRVPAGEYVVALTARQGAHAARDRQRLIVGDRLPLATARRLVAGPSLGDAAGPARTRVFPSDHLRDCRRVTPQRVDCVIDWQLDYARVSRRAGAGAEEGCFVAALQLRPDGFVYTRDYTPPQALCISKGSGRLIDAHPRWSGRAKEARPL